MTSRDRTSTGDEPYQGEGRATRFPFKFRLGELTLFSLARPLVVVEREPGDGEWDWPDVAKLPDDADGCVIKGIQAVPRLNDSALGGKWSARILKSYPRHLVDLTTGFDAYMAKFSGKTRSTLKRKLRKFEELSGGKTDWKEFRTRDEMAGFLPLARQLSSKTYQERLLDAGLPDSAAFAAKALRSAERGEVRAYILFLNARPVSYLYLPVHGHRVEYAYLGYDPDCAEHSPGIVLQLLAMERLFAESGLAVFDFTEGAGRHKELFATHRIECVDILLVKRRTLTAWIAPIHAAFERAEVRLSKLFDRLGLKKSLKRLLRRAATKQSAPVRG